MIPSWLCKKRKKKRRRKVATGRKGGVLPPDKSREIDRGTI